MPHHFFRYSSLCGAAALLLSGLCACADAPLTDLPADITAALSKTFSPQEAVRKGILFSAISPRTEQDLEKLDGTPASFSVTIPMEIDRRNKRLFVLAQIDSHPIHLIIDTGGGPMIALNDAAAKSLHLQSQFRNSFGGLKSGETVTEGFAHTLTLGNLTLQTINTVVRHSALPFYDCTLGTQVFERYRVTLDFDAKTMTLSRGGMPAASPTGKSSLSVPFQDNPGAYISFPVHILSQPSWAVLDSGSDGSLLSISMAKLAAAQLPPTDFVSSNLDRKTGIGSDEGLTTINLRVPVPVSLDAAQNAPHLPVEDGFKFSTTSQFGVSGAGDEVESFLSHPVGAELGLPFLLQFRRVIIDYPNHILTLQDPEHGAEVYMFERSIDDAKVASKLGKPWPGYHWRPVGDGWVEVPDKAAAVPVTAADGGR